MKGKIQSSKFQFPKHIWNFGYWTLFGVWVLGFGFFAFGISAIPRGVAAAVKASGTPRIANYYLKWDLSDDDARALRAWDIVILDMEVQERSQQQLRTIKRLNPNITILAYVTSQEIRDDASTFPESSLRRKLASRISPAWYLTDVHGKRVSWWAGTTMLNVSDSAPLVDGKRWNSALASFLSDTVLSSGLWDGVFLDNAWASISWMPFSSTFDLNRDGQAESREELDRSWRSGMESLVAELRRRARSSVLVFGNLNKSGPNLANVLDGGMLENFPDPGWESFMTTYARLEQGRPGFAVVLNGNTKNRGSQANYPLMRFTLASTLLGDGFTSFDYGDKAHEQLWHYDEYDAVLGLPTGVPHNLLLFRQTGGWEPGLWQRDFTHAVVLLNSTRKDQTTRFNDPLDRMMGTQDMNVNSGAPVTDVTIAPGDGLVLLKPVSELFGVVFPVGSFVRVFTKEGTTKRRGFFPIISDTAGGAHRFTGDLDGDGGNDAVYANASTLVIKFSNGVTRAVFSYGRQYRGGITFAVGDLNGDRLPEIVTGALRGGAHVQVYDHHGRLVGGFFAFQPKGSPGVRVAVGDVDGDGRGEIITTQAQTPSAIRIFRSNGKLVREWDVIEKLRFKIQDLRLKNSGFILASGDLDGDGRAEVLVGTGKGVAPVVGIFSGRGAMMRQFVPLVSANRDGFILGVGDVDGDGVGEVLVMAERVL